MEIRKTVESDDFTAIARIYAESWKAAYQGIVPQPYLDSLTEDRWAKLLPVSPWINLVATENGRYLGTSSVCPARDEAMPGWGEIVSIYLLPEYFGKGLGSSLLAAAESELHKMGFKQIYLWVLEENLRARSFYQRHGFTVTSDRTYYEINEKNLVELRYCKSLT